MFSHVVKVSNLNGYLAPVFVTLGTLFNLLVHKRISTATEDLTKCCGTQLIFGVTY